MRGPLTLPGPLNPAGSQPRPTRREGFDELVLGLVERLSVRWGKELADVEFGTEDVPAAAGRLGRRAGAVRLAGPGDGRDQPARIVLFRRPIELRAKTQARASPRLPTRCWSSTSPTCSAGTRPRSIPRP